jgi:hypothetical protein
MIVGMIANNTNTTAEVYFAKTIFISDSGFVRSNSIVPDLCSSANILIVTAGMRNKKSQGAIRNNASNVAYPFSRMLKSEPGKIHMINPVAIRKTSITI